MENKRKRGRPKKAKNKIDLYDALKIGDKFDYIEDRLAFGMTESDLAASLGVARTTYYKWKDTKPEFYRAIERGKLGQIQLVENQLLKKILGYSVEETEELQDNDGNVMQRKVKTKFINPDTTSMIFYLKNRNPEEWKDRVENHNTGGFEFDVRVNGLDEE